MVAHSLSGMLIARVLVACVSVSVVMVMTHSLGSMILVEACVSVAGVLPHRWCRNLVARTRWVLSSYASTWATCWLLVKWHTEFGNIIWVLVARRAAGGRSSIVSGGGWLCCVGLLFVRSWFLLGCSIGWFGCCIGWFSSSISGRSYISGRSSISCRICILLSLQEKTGLQFDGLGFEGEKRGQCDGRVEGKLHLFCLF